MVVVASPASDPDESDVRIHPFPGTCSLAGSLGQVAGTRNVPSGGPWKNFTGWTDEKWKQHVTKKNKSEVVTLGLDWTLRWSGSIKPAEFRKTGALQLRWPPGSGTYRSSSLHIFRPCLTKKWCEEKKSERAIRDGGRRQVWPVALWPGLRCQQILAHFVIITIPILPVQSRLAVAVSNTSIRYWSRERERGRETPDALPCPGLEPCQLKP